MRSPTRPPSPRRVLPSPRSAGLSGEVRRVIQNIAAHVPQTQGFQRDSLVLSGCRDFRKSRAGHALHSYHFRQTPGTDRPAAVRRDRRTARRGRLRQVVLQLGSSGGADLRAAERPRQSSGAAGRLERQFPASLSPRQRRAFAFDPQRRQQASAGRRLRRCVRRGRQASRPSMPKRRPRLRPADRIRPPSRWENCAIGPSPTVASAA